MAGDESEGEREDMNGMDRVRGGAGTMAEVKYVHVAVVTQATEMVIAARLAQIAASDILTRAAIVQSLVVPNSTAIKLDQGMGPNHPVANTR